jgi:GrpB-like predicted nucleotidyltransferase (UPF0157 family)
MVELQEYRASRAVEFQVESAHVRDVLVGRVDEVEHIGSTAVPTMTAKPIIDIAARAVPAVSPFSLGEGLSILGYALHTTGPKNHAVYVRSHEARRSHILHVFTAAQWPLCNQRVVRDKLLGDFDARNRYRNLKLSIGNSADGRDYTAAKRALIEELLNDERSDRGLPPTSAWDK